MRCGRGASPVHEGIIQSGFVKLIIFLLPEKIFLPTAAGRNENAKKNMMIRYFNSLLWGFLTMACFSVMAQGEAITLEKLFRDNYFRVQSITRGQSMQDGLRYAVIEGRTDLNVYDYETGTLQQTVFSTRGRLTGENGNALPIDDYSFSLDESMLLIGVNQESIYRYSRVATYFIWKIAEEELLPLSGVSRQRLPEFSPDGSMVAFVRANNLFVKDLNSGEEHAITRDGEKNHIINGTADWVYEEEFSFTKGFFWSPDSRRIAWMRFDEGHVKEFTMMMYGSLYPSEYRFKYPKAGEDNALVSIHIYDIATRQAVVADARGDQEHYIPRVQWTKDPDKLAIQRLTRQQNKLEVLLADAGSGRTSLLYAENNLYYISITNDLTFLDDGRHFIISSERSGYNHLYLYDMKGRRVRALSSGEWDVERYLGVDEENGLAYYLARVDSPLNNALYSVGLDGRSTTRLTASDGINSPAFSRGFRYFINSFSTISAPPVHSIHHAGGKLIKVLEDNRVLRERADRHGFSDPSFFTFTTTEGVALNGMMVLPPDFDPANTYPVFMYVYGGPGSQTVVNRWNPSNGVWFQMLAQKGFIVVSVDNRGTGYRGERFRKMTYLELGKYETIDQAEAAQYLAGLPFVDGGRIAIFGWSYGGYLSALCLAKAPDHFAAAISVAPVTNWRFYDTIYTERYMRTPRENPEGYDNNSPINHVPDIKGKLMLVHGSADDNVHYQNTLEMTAALIDAGVQFELMIYPDSNHGIGGTQTRLHLYRMMTDFLLRNLR